MWNDRKLVIGRKRGESRDREIGGERNRGEGIWREEMERGEEREG